MAMIKVFSEQLFRKVSAIQTRENRPLDCFAEQSLKKSKLKNPCSQVWIDQPANMGRQTSDRVTTILMFMFHSMGGGYHRKGRVVGFSGPYTKPDTEGQSYLTI